MDYFQKKVLLRYYSYVFLNLSIYGLVYPVYIYSVPLNMPY